MCALPEIRKLVATAEQYIAGECYFSHIIGHANDCLMWGKIYGVHPAILRLASEWLQGADEVWNEFSQHPKALPEETFRLRIASDLGYL